MMGFNRSVRAGLVFGAGLVAAAGAALAGSTISTGAIETAVRNIAATRIPSTVTAHATNAGQMGTFSFTNAKTGRTFGVSGTLVGASFKVTSTARSGSCLLLYDTFVAETMLNGGTDFLAWYAIAALDRGYPQSAGEAESVWRNLYGAGSLLGHERFMATRKDSAGRVTQWGYFSPVSAQDGSNTSAHYNYSKTIDLGKDGHPYGNFIAGAGQRWAAYSR